MTVQAMKADIHDMGREVEILFMTRMLARNIIKWDKSDHKMPELAEKLFKEGVNALKDHQIEGMDAVFTIHEGESFVLAKLSDAEQERLARVAYAHQIVQRSKGNKDYLLELGFVNVNELRGRVSLEVAQAVEAYVKDARDKQNDDKTESESK